MSDIHPSGYWLDQAVAHILEQYPKDEKIVVSSGISPSASYHIGHFREILTADALVWGIRRTGRTAAHVHVVDDFDPLRKRYSFLPESFEQYVGQPICFIPDPFDDGHRSYADHYFEEFRIYAEQMGIVPDEIKKSQQDLYASGLMAPQIEKVMQQIDDVRRILEEVSNRPLPPDWTPLQVIDEQTGTFHNAKSASYEVGQIEGLKLDSGKVKLNWRLDWPARWQVLGVKVEPFSAQEHGAAGGSYDTGVRFSREVFGYEPPIPAVQYGNIHLLGESTKMSSSKGNLVTPAQALELMPVEILRYFVVRSKPDRTLYWDSGLGLYRLLDEFAEVQAAALAGQPHEFIDAYNFAVNVGASTQRKQVISSIPFSHLVSTYQAARGTEKQILEMLERTGYKSEVAQEKAILIDELSYVKNWLEKYAPEDVKFTVQEAPPIMELSTEQAAFLDLLAAKLEPEPDLNGQGMHDLIYAVLQECGIRPNQAFVSIYRVILGKDAGPKAGWFLASLDHDWLVQRLRRTI